MSGLLHAAAIVLVLGVTGVRHPPAAVSRFILVTPADIGAYRPVVPRKMEGGGGGGTRSPLPASIGRLPKFSTHQYTPPVAVIENFNPQLPMAPTLIGDPRIELPTLDLPQYGAPNGVAGPASGGPGAHGGIGGGDGTGVGNSKGPGYGDGPGGGGVTSGDARFQGTITQPVLLWKIEPEYTEEARRAKIQGTVLLYVEVDARGQPQNIQVHQSLGLGLDERAIEAVRRWKFRAGTRNGKPYLTTAVVEVNFRLL
ncbi:MAG: energy transducer TonB [Acidobacteriia bacterium]|nr:energy transducer TonB [Terriglobia bacterium]